MFTWFAAWQGRADSSLTGLGRVAEVRHGGDALQEVDREEVRGDVLSCTCIRGAGGSQGDQEASRDVGEKPGEWVCVWGEAEGRMCVNKGSVIKNAFERQSTIRTERGPGSCVHSCSEEAVRRSVSGQSVVRRTEGGGSG